MVKLALLIVNYHYNVVGCELDALVACIRISDTGCQYNCVRSGQLETSQHSCTGP